jgi:rhodanese-related sulfurtransferase
MAKQVNPSEAAELLSKGWKYLDVRSIPEFEQGHPEGATNVPLLHSQAGRMIPNPEFQQVIEANFAKDDKLVVGCKMSGRSAQAVAVLEAAGYTQLAHMRGGFSGERDMYGRVSAPGWAESGLPVATQPVPGASYAELAKKK